MVVFGPPGCGKTTFLGSMTEAQPEGKILLFDTDLGRESVADLDVDYLLPTSWTELRGYLDYALEVKDEGEYTTYGFDSLSSIYYELLVPKVCGGEGKRFELQHYLEAQRILAKFVRDAKSLREYGINTIFTAHQKEINDDGTINIRLSLPEGIRNEILLTVNHVGYLARGKDNRTRELWFEPPTKRHDGVKVRQTRSTGTVPEVIANPTMKKFLDAIQGTTTK
jgi:energy-coupling factor transporter ATP-binding protein EcfA2